MSRLDLIRDKHLVVLSTDDIRWLLDLAIQIDRLYRSERESDTALAASEQIIEMLELVEE